MPIDNSVLAFIIIAVVIFTVYITVMNMMHKDPVKEKLKKIVEFSGAENKEIGSDENERSSLELLMESVLKATGVDITRASAELYPKLAPAGLMSDGAVIRYLFYKRYIGPVLAVIGGVALYKAYTVQSLGTAMLAQWGMIGGMLVIFGLLGPELYTSNKKKHREQNIQKSFADTLDLLTVCMEAGLPFDSALGRLCTELKNLHPEASEELERTRIELNVLNDRVQALNNLAFRTGTEGYKVLVSSLVQAEKFGTNLVDTLRTLSDEYREQQMLDAENKAAKVPALITLPLIAFILPSFLALIMTPPIIKINQQGGIMGESGQE